MPFFHQMGRERLRALYLEAWRRHRERLPLEPLHAEIASVIELHPEYHAALEAGPETLARTNLGELRRGSRVNLERSLRVGDLLGGHFVTGHIDGVGMLDERRDEGAWSTCWFRVPRELAAQMVPKGSVAVDGVSLTVVEVQPDRFSVMLIPHTLAVTTLGSLAVGGNSPAISPSYITRIRSESDSTSSSSRETSRIPLPSSRSSIRRRWTNSIAPTSRPRVGWAAINTFGLRSISRASTTFC